MNEKISYTLVSATVIFLLALSYVNAITDTAGSGGTQASVNYIAMGNITASASGTSTSVGVYVDGASCTGVRTAIYENNATDEPSTLLGESADTPPVATSWNDLTIAGVNIVAGNRYWLAAQMSNADCAFEYQGGTNIAFWRTWTYGAFINPFAGSGANPTFYLRLNYEPPAVIYYNYTNITVLTNGTSTNKIISYGDILNITVLMNASGYADVNITSAPTITVPNYTAKVNFTWLLNLTNDNYFSNSGWNNTINVTYYGNQTQNYTSAITYVYVQRANTSYNINISNSTKITKGTSYGVECRLNVTKSPNVFYLYQNSTEKNNTNNPFVLYNISSAALGTWRYYCLAEYGGNNYTDALYPDYNVTVEKAPMAVNVTLWLNGTTGVDTCTYPCAGRNFTVQSNLTGVNVLLWRNGTLLSNTTITDTANNVSTYWSKVNEFSAKGYNGWWNITAEIDGNASYEGLSMSRTLSVGLATRTCTLATDKTFTRTYDATASSTTCDASVESEGTIDFTRNSTAKTSPDSVTNAAWYAYSCGWSASDNYTACTPDTDNLFINQTTIQPRVLINSSRYTWHSYRNGANEAQIFNWGFGAFDPTTWLNLSFEYTPNLPTADVACSISYGDAVKGTSWVTKTIIDNFNVQANCSGTTNVYANGTGEDAVFSALGRAYSYPQVLLNSSGESGSGLAKTDRVNYVVSNGNTLYNISCHYKMSETNPHDNVYGDVQPQVAPQCYLEESATFKGRYVNEILISPYCLVGATPCTDHTQYSNGNGYQTYNYYSYVYNNSTIVRGNVSGYGGGEHIILTVLQAGKQYPMIAVNGSVVTYQPNYPAGTWLNVSCYNACVEDPYAAWSGVHYGSCSCRLYENNTDVGTWVMRLYNKSTWHFKANASRDYNLNYSANATGAENDIIIDKGNVYPYVLVNGSRIFTYIKDNWVNITCRYSSQPNSSNSEPSCSISRDGVLKGTGEIVQLPAGSYLIKANSTATENYSANSTGETILLASSDTPVQLSLVISSNAPSCGAFQPSIGTHNYSAWTTINVSVYPYCTFGYWNFSKYGFVLFDTNFTFAINGNYTAYAYFNMSGQGGDYGGGISANATGAVAYILNPFLSGYMFLAMFHLGITGLAVYITRSVIFGVGIFFLFLLVFLAGNLYPNYLWVIIIAIVAMILTILVAQIRGNQA